MKKLRGKSFFVHEWIRRYRGAQPKGRGRDWTLGKKNERG